MAFMRALPSGLRELLRKEVKRREEPEGTDNSKETAVWTLRHW